MFLNETWDAMFEHAEAEYPAECCGIITVDGEGKHAVHACENIQDKMHAADPETHPRTSKEAYMIDPMQQFRIESASEKAGGRIVAFYHSHIDVGAYFSRKDQADAVFSPKDQTDAVSKREPIYPGAVYPVIAVKEGKVDRTDSKVFGWKDGVSGFEELTS